MPSGAAKCLKLKGLIEKGLPLRPLWRGTERQPALIVPEPPLGMPPSFRAPAFHVESFKMRLHNTDQPHQRSSRLRDVPLPHIAAAPAASSAADLLRRSVNTAFIDASLAYN